LGIPKVKAKAYHPECNSMVERFNHTLKSMLYKHAYTDKFGAKWHRYLSGLDLLWAYRNMLHESTGMKPSFLLIVEHFLQGSG